MKNFNELINSAAASCKVEIVDPVKTPLTEEEHRAYAQQMSGINVAFLLGGQGRRDFGYGQAVNVTSQGGRASFDAVAVVPGEISYSPTRSLNGTVKIGQVTGPVLDLPYVRQVQPQGGAYSVPFTEESGWETVGNNKVLRWKYIFSFGPECVPNKVTSFPLSWRGWSFSPGGMDVNTIVSQSGNPAGIQTVGDSGLTLNIRIQPTCEGAPSFQQAPQR